MTLRRLWAKLRLELHDLQTVERGSRFYEAMVDAGVGREALDGYIACGRGRKRPGCAPSSGEETRQQVRELVRAGGTVAGGAAVRSWLQVRGARDYDVFFPDTASFVKAHLAAYGNPDIDVCLYEREPYELFDLGACKCGYSASEFMTDPSFDEAMRTGVSDIELAAVVHPTATLRRVAKYGRTYGLRFPMPKVLLLATTSGVDADVAREAVRFAA